MVDVLSRSTLELRRDVHAADFPADQWIVDPDLTAVACVPLTYWKIVGDLVMEMDPVEKAAVNAVLLHDARETGQALLEVELLTRVAARYPDHRRQLLLALQANAVAEGRVQRAAYLRRLPQWIEDGLRTHLYPAQDAVASATLAAGIERMELDLHDWLAADPKVSVREALAIED